MFLPSRSERAKSSCPTCRLRRHVGHYDFARSLREGSSYLIVSNFLSPLNFFPPSSVPPPLSLFSAPTPLPLLGPWTFCGLSLGTRWRFVYPGADQCAWFSMSGAPEVSRHSVDILWTFHGPSADLLRACLPPTHPHPSSPHPPPPTRQIF